MTTSATGKEHGYTAPGFEPVRDALVGSRRLGGGGAAFAAYVDGELVVDVHTGEARPGEPWGPDTLAMLMSITKSFMSFSLQILDDRGELDLDAKVARYWPEFAANGKADITVRQLQLHTAGLIRVPPQLRLTKGSGDGWDDYDGIAEALAAEAPVWPPGTDHGYHALTYGWLVGEVLRRITGTSPGEFLRKEVIDPLGLDIHIGLDDAALGRVAGIIDFDNDELGFPQKLLMPRLARAMTDPNTFAGMAFGGTGDGHSIISDVVALTEHGGILRAEVMSSSACATAAALARFFSMLALGGELDGHRFVSEASMRKWTAPMPRMGDRVVTQSLPGWLVKLGQLDKATAVTRTLGYLYNDAPRGPRPLGPTPSAFGGLGAGGQVGFADPVRRVSAGFVRNALAHKPDAGNEVVSALYSCLDERG